MPRVRPARAYQPKNHPLRMMADAAAPRVQRALVQALQMTRRNLDMKAAAALVARVDIAGLVALLDLHHQGEALRRPMGMLGALYLDGADYGARKINGTFGQRQRRVRYKKSAPDMGGGEFTGRSAALMSAGSQLQDYLIERAIAKDQADYFDFDRFDYQTQQTIRAYQDALISSLNAAQRDTVVEILRLAFQTGETDPETVAAALRRVIGLTPQQARAVENLRLALEEADTSILSRRLLPAADAAIVRRALANGEHLSSEMKAQIADNYADAFLAYRAGMIAQTEVTRSASLGLQGAYQQAVDRGVMPAGAVTQHWHIALDEKVCPVCLSVYDHNPDGVPLGESFDSSAGPIQSPPAHPNCRCTLELVTNLDMVPDDFGEQLNEAQFGLDA